MGQKVVIVGDVAGGASAGRVSMCSYVVARILQQHGYQVKSMTGGYTSVLQST